MLARAQPYLVLCFVFVVLFASPACSSCPRGRASLGRRGVRRLNSGGERMLLPTNIQPIHYDLTFEPVSTVAFNGHAVIGVDVRESSRSITLNSERLHLSEITVTTGSRVLKCLGVSRNHTTGFTILTLEDSIPVGEATLDIKYNGTMDNGDATESPDIGDLGGFYTSSYTLPDGTSAYYHVTQFEPVDASRAFPCWDEPAIKASFTVTLVAASNLTCISNMPEESVKVLEGGKKAVRFQPSPTMSTYLVAFAMGDFAFIESNDFRVPIRAYVPSTYDPEACRLAVDTAAKGMEYYEHVLGVEYPLPKLDFLSLTDMSAGGMENWGLITIHSDFFPSNRERVSAAQKVRLVTVILHELAHMWFGDLVTMEWWNDLWLNEGFATHFETYATMAIYPDWNMEQEFLVNGADKADKEDETGMGLPVRANVTTGHEAVGMFSTITYQKGAAIITMLRAKIGDEDFFAALTEYLRAHEKQNVKTSDLFRSLSDQTGQDISYYMSAWVDRPGFPILDVAEDKENDAIVITQKSFLEERQGLEETGDDTVWPVFLMTGGPEGSTNTSAVMTAKEQTFHLGSLDFYHLNTDYTGMYRVRYTSERVAQLAASMERLSPNDIIGLISDTCRQSTDGWLTSATDCLGLVAAATERDDGYYVWRKMIWAFGFIESTWAENEKIMRHAGEIQERYLTAKVRSMGWNMTYEEPVVSELFKKSVFLEAGLAGNTEVINVALDKFGPLVNGELDAEHIALWVPIMCLGMRYGNESAYAAVRDALDRFGLTASGDVDFKHALLQSLQCARAPDGRGSARILYNGDDKWYHT